jgi:hypothetical protein
MARAMTEAKRKKRPDRMAQSLQLKSLVGCRWRIVDPSLELQFCAGLAGKIVNYRTIVDGRNVAPIVSPRATKAKEYAKDRLRPIQKDAVACHTLAIFS